jgi:hypothetical protein
VNGFPQGSWRRMSGRSESHRGDQCLSQAKEGSQKGNSAVTSLRIFAHGKAKPGQAAVLRALVVDLLKNPRGKSGLEIYEAFEGLDGQEFIFSEQLSSQTSAS